jgi:hypothetical protein
VRGDEPCRLASYLRIEERELEAGREEAKLPGAIDDSRTWDGPRPGATDDSRTWDHLGDVGLDPDKVLGPLTLAFQDPPEPWVLVDLAPIWVPGEGVAADTTSEIVRLVLLAFRRSARLTSSRSIVRWVTPGSP